MTSLMKESKSIMTNKMNKGVFVTKKFINVEMCYTSYCNREITKHACKKLLTKTKRKYEKGEYYEIKKVI